MDMRIIWSRLKRSEHNLLVRVNPPQPVVEADNGPSNTGQRIKSLQSSKLMALIGVSPRPVRIFMLHSVCDEVYLESKIFDVVL
jgi:hypothetical protein